MLEWQTVAAPMPQLWKLRLFLPPGEYILIRKHDLDFAGGW